MSGGVLWESTLPLFSSRLQAHKGPERSVGAFVAKVEESAAARLTTSVTPQHSCCSRTTVDALRRSCECDDGLMGGRGKVDDLLSSEQLVGSPATATHSELGSGESTERERVRERK